MLTVPAVKVQQFKQELYLLNLSATLRRRVFKTFDLERFGIDVVICRRGDRERRQLLGDVRLGKYKREEP